MAISRSVTTTGEYLARLTEPPRHQASGFGQDGPEPGVTVLIPTYTAPGNDRTESLRLCLARLHDAARVAGIRRVAVVLVDNGLSIRDARRVGELLRGSGLTYQVVPAAAVHNGRYAAARARNEGLAYLAQLPAGSALRQPYLMFLDDDTAPAPDALATLHAALREQDRAVAACPRVVPVADLARWPGSRAASTAGPRRLPGALRREGGYDLLSVTAHGSSVTGRTVGLLVRQDAVLRHVCEHGPLFFEGTPFGSTEDMLAMGVLSQIGELWSVPAAEVADEARATPGATRRQQFAWGYDHAWLARALAEAGALVPGVHVLAWQPGAGWVHCHLDWGPYTGFLINPEELLLGCRLLDTLCADRAVASQVFGERADRVRAGTGALRAVLQRWRASAPTAARRPRADLPSLGNRDWTSLRDGLDALTGHLAGNVVGSLDAAPYFLYGARQPDAPHVPSPR